MKQQLSRRLDIDWLRVLSILVVFFFHNNRFFDLGGWHVKNANTYEFSQVISDFLALWMMPLIFIVSGASTVFAVRPGKGGRFILERARRLVVPLVVGIFTMIPLQVYLERLSHKQFFGSFWSFLPHYFDGMYGFGGNFAWMGLHLWYLEVLFVFSVLCLPLFLFLKSERGAAFLGRLDGFLARPAAIYLLALPVAALITLLDPNGVLGRKDFGGWSLLAYILFLVYGFILFAGERAQQAIVRQRMVSLVAALVLSAALLAADLNLIVLNRSATAAVLTFGLGLAAWAWIVALLGFGMKHLRTVDSPFLAYANEAVLPFYILHQTVILVIGYFVVQWDVHPLLKYGVTAVTSFGVILLLYEFLVRRVNLLRVLFGMKPVRPESRKAVEPHAALR